MDKPVIGEGACWWKRQLCKVGVHWSGTVDGGAMGDCMRCDICGKDKYPEVFPGIILRPRCTKEPYNG